MSNSTPAHREYSFGDLTVSIDRGAVLQGGNQVPLRRQSFEVLVYLLERHGCLVSKEELLDAVWKSKTVTDGSVTQCLREIRAAIGDSGHEVIRTVPKGGYLFDAPVIEKANAPPTYLARTSWWQSRAVFVLVGVLLTIGLAALRWGFPARDPVELIAIMAFDNIGGADDGLSFRQGLRSEISTEIGQINGLAVIAELSVDLVEQSDPRDFRNRLGASYLLTGSVSRANNNMRLNFKLVDTGTAEQLWSDSYYRTVSIDNVLEVEKDIAVNVANAVGLELDRDTPRPAQTSRPASLAAWDSYNDGLYFLRRIETGTLDDKTIFEAAIEQFTASIEADPNWAPAHAAIGRVYHFWYSSGEAEKLASSQAHIDRAIKLDDRYAPAYASLGYVLYRKRDFAGAAEAYRRLRDLGSDMTWGYAILLRALGDWDGAIDAYQNAVVRDPLAGGPRTQLSWTYLCAERYDDAIENWEEMLDAGFDEIPLLQNLAYAYSAKGLTDRGIELAEKSIAAGGSEADLVAVFAVAGLSDRAEAALASAEALGPVYPFHRVILALETGDEDRALTILEQIADQSPESLLKIRCFKGIKKLDGNPRFRRVLEQIGFPD